MTDETFLTDETPEESTDPVDLPPAPPVTDRFLFVDIAALRAKQLRRGARPRLAPDAVRPDAPAKPERIAMEEVRQQLVHYELPTFKGRNAENYA
jgi:DNA-directed RNA polymerase subunit K/omega